MDCAAVEGNINVTFLASRAACVFIKSYDHERYV